LKEDTRKSQGPARDRGEHHTRHTGNPENFSIGIGPAITARTEIPLAPIHGAVRITSIRITTQDPMTVRKRVVDSARLPGGYDEGAEAIGTLDEDAVISKMSYKFPGVSTCSGGPSAASTPSRIAIILRA